LRLQSLYLRHSYRYDPLTGLSSAGIEPQLHQVFVAHRVTQKLEPRMILADEVGLGKTIEAGLIIKELRARGLLDRVLIVVPASLQLQWQSELKSKFNEEFEILDGAALQYLGRGKANPWMARHNVICSLPFASSPKRAEQIIEADWDLVVFGYPLPLNTRDTATRQPKIKMNAMLFKGYVVRIRIADFPGQPETRSYELDMPAPPGLSGSPVLRAGSRDVVGVVVTERGYEIPREDRMIYLAYAHHLWVLRAARGAATGNIPLDEFLARAS
jgi:SNF2-related domain